jgi:hypothetical protein
VALPKETLSEREIAGRQRAKHEIVDVLITR